MNKISIEKDFQTKSACFLLESLENEFQPNKPSYLIPTPIYLTIPRKTSEPVDCLLHHANYTQLQSIFCPSSSVKKNTIHLRAASSKRDNWPSFGNAGEYNERAPEAGVVLLVVVVFECVLHGSLSSSSGTAGSSLPVTRAPQL